MKRNLINDAGGYSISLSIFSVLLLSLLLLPSLNKEANAEAWQLEPERNKLSIQLYGGSYIARTNLGITPFTGAIGVNTRYFNPSFGADIEYMPISTLGIKGMYNYTIIEGDDVSFKNTYHSISGGVNLYLRNIMLPERETSRFSPYLSLIIGQSKHDWDGASSEWSGHYGYGLGTKIQLGGRIDWLLNYQYKYFNPGASVAGVGVNSFERDRLASLMTGLSVKFGSSSNPHARWYSPVAHTRQAVEKVDEASRRRDAEWDQVLQNMDAQAARMAQIEEATADSDQWVKQDELKRTIAEMESKMAQLAEELEEKAAKMEVKEVKPEPVVEEKPEPKPSEWLVSDLAAGFYIQAFASRDLDAAEREIAKMVSQLEEQGISVRDHGFVIYQQANGFYTVRVGPYASLLEARGVLPNTQNVFEDAYILTVN